jgi:hypothetical protein
MDHAPGNALEPAALPGPAQQQEEQGRNAGSPLLAALTAGIQPAARLPASGEPGGSNGGRPWQPGGLAAARDRDLAGYVTTPSGHVAGIPVGGRVVFGRGSGVDLRIPGVRGLSRRAGVITGEPGGIWVANISRTHALYAEGGGYRIRLPRVEQHGEATAGWFLRAGTMLVGSRVMVDEGRALSVVASPPGGAEDMTVTGGKPGSPSYDLDGDPTLVPLYLDPMTKLFLVALMWCQPWLLDPSRTTPLPRTPEIARATLEATGAYHELERFDGDPAFRDRLSARVAEHVKVLRRKIADRGLVRADTRLSDEVVVQVLLDYGIITVADLARLNDAAWCSRQEDLWWTQAP